MERFIAFIIVSFGVLSCVLSQDFDSYFTGNAQDAKVHVNAGFLLAGGGRDNDEAMRWMLNRATGGDVLILRASGSDGYNSYVYRELGVNINSVETIVFRHRRATSLPEILDKVDKAEIIFIAGGDQTRYFNLWNNTPLAAKLIEAMTQKTKVIGGTSAGMMILSGIAYTPINSGVNTTDALSNPFHANIDDLKTPNLMGSSIFENMIFDTHFDNRTRDGRLFTFLARTAFDHKIRARAIACNEQTAIGIDEKFIAHVFGRDNTADQKVYFMETNCEENGLPNLVSGRPLTWNTDNNNSVIVQIVDGFSDARHSFDLNEWVINTDGVIQHWNATQGQLSKRFVNSSDCKVATSHIEKYLIMEEIYPNPTNGIINFSLTPKATLLDTSGTELKNCDNCKSMTISNMSKGIYYLKLQHSHQTSIKKVVLIE